MTKIKLTFDKTNPYRVKLNDYANSEYVLGRFTQKDENGKEQRYIVLIDINDGNRYTEPIMVTKKEFMEISIDRNTKVIKKIIKQILK